jgi:hypothetical protein
VNFYLLICHLTDCLCFSVVDGTASEAYSMASAKSRICGQVGNAMGRASNKKSFQRKISLTAELKY